MSVPVTLGAAAAVPPASPRPPQSVAEAAKQFEALMIAQLLKTARGDENGWLGTGEDTGDATAARRRRKAGAQPS